MEQQRKDGNTSRISKGGEEMMVPYARLSESCKEYDRVTVRAVLDALDAIGYAVAPASEPTPDLAALLDDYELACYRHQSIPSLERHARVTTARATLDRSLAALSARVERDATDAERYRFLRDNPLQLRAIDGNAGWCGQILPYHFDAQTDATRGTP